MDSVRVPSPVNLVSASAAISILYLANSLSTMAVCRSGRLFDLSRSVRTFHEERIRDLTLRLSMLFLPLCWSPASRGELARDDSSRQFLPRLFLGRPQSGRAMLSLKRAARSPGQDLTQLLLDCQLSATITPGPPVCEISADSLQLLRPAAFAVRPSPQGFELQMTWHI